MLAKSKIANQKSQIPLPLFTVPAEDPNIRWLADLLRERGWLKRKQIVGLASVTGRKYDERWVRAIVFAAKGEIIRGQKGFNHEENCTLDELTHCANQSESQGKLMIEYGLCVRRRAHQRLK